MKNKDKVLQAIFDNDPMNILDISKDKQISQTEYDAILGRMAISLGVSTILSIPGVYELVTEELHNEVLCEWERSL